MPEAFGGPPGPVIDPHELATHRVALLRYARLQLRDEAWAEDVVSETLLVALEKPRSFQARSQLRTWLIGILKHKVVDMLRRHQREVALPSSEDLACDELDDLIFRADGHFREAPRDWGDPAARLGERQFLALLEACVEKLPGQAGRVFLMREWLELESEEICHTLGISASNLWVILHRARLRLRECLQLQGVGGPGA